MNFSYTRIKILLVMVLGVSSLSIKGQINVKRNLRETNHEIYDVTYSRDGKYIATTGSDNNVIIWNAEAGTIYRTLSGLNKRPNAVVFSSDNKRLFSAGEDNLISMWDPLSISIIKRFEGHRKPIKSIDVSPNDKLLASGGKDRLVRIWDVESGTLVFELSAHKKDVNALKFSPDGSKLVSGSADGSLILWDVRTGALISRVAAHNGWVRCLDYSNDGKYIASGGYDNLVKIWRSPRLEFLNALEGHDKWVQSVSFSPDDRYLLSGGHDQQIILWDITEGKIIARSENQGQIVLSVNFHPELPDFVSATLYSEDLKIWSYGLTGTTQMKLPEKGKEISNTKEQIVELKDTAQPEVKEFVVMDTPSSEITRSPSISLFSPLPVAGKIQHNKQQIFLIGKVEDPAGINVFLVNKEIASLSEAGVFQFNIDLIPGLNSIELVAINNNGKMNTRELVIECSAEISEETSKPGSSFNKGIYYGLIIGIDEYQDPRINKLDHPINDAERFYNVLVNKYTFNPENIIFLKNPSRMEMIMAFETYSKKITNKDNLLIFYAGHGYWDEKSGVGYWLPSDALKGSSVNWFRNSTLRDFIGGIQSKHTILIADACFSGTIFKTRAAFTENAAGIQKLYELPSRKAMTSGSLKEVPDESVFLKYLIARLEENEEPFLLSEILFSSFKTAVLNNSPNVPQYGTIQNVGDEGGDFIFIRK